MSFGLDKSPLLIQIVMRDGLGHKPAGPMVRIFGDWPAISRTNFNLPEQGREAGFRLVVPVNKRSLFKES